MQTWMQGAGGEGDGKEIHWENQSGMSQVSQQLTPCSAFQPSEPYLGTLGDLQAGGSRGGRRWPCVVESTSWSGMENHLAFFSSPGRPRDPGLPWPQGKQEGEGGHYLFCEEPKRGLVTGMHTARARWVRAYAYTCASHMCLLVYKIV